MRSCRRQAGSPTCLECGKRANVPSLRYANGQGRSPNQRLRVLPLPGATGFTVMAMTVKPDAHRSAPNTFRDEGLYAFRFDLNGGADRRDVHLGAPAKHRGLVHARGIRSERRLRARAWRLASSFDRIPNAPWMRFNVATCDDPRIVRWLERQLAKAPNGNLGLSQ
jgi:hypothetical protein